MNKTASKNLFNSKPYNTHCISYVKWLYDDDLVRFIFSSNQCTTLVHHTNDSMPSIQIAICCRHRTRLNDRQRMQVKLPNAIKNNTKYKAF
jgi:hypothetical protein